MQAISTVLDALSYPRRAIWSALGLPTHGSQVLGHFGLDPSKPLTRLLGVGVEMAGDPLTYAGGYLAKSLLGAGAEAGGEAQSLGGINPAMAAQLDDVLLAAVNGRGHSDDDQTNQTPSSTQSAILRKLRS